MASTFTLVFIVLLALTTAVRLWLGTRQINYVQAHRAKVPSAFSGDISLDSHQKAADYSSAKTRLVIIEVIVQTAAQCKSQ